MKKQSLEQDSRYSIHKDASDAISMLENARNAFIEEYYFNNQGVGASIMQFIDSSIVMSLKKLAKIRKDAGLMYDELTDDRKERNERS